MVDMTFACPPPNEHSTAVAEVPLRAGDHVHRAGGGAGGARSGVVLSVWTLFGEWRRYPPGTRLAKVRFRGTWRRFGGGRGDAVVILRADRLVKEEMGA